MKIANLLVVAGAFSIILPLVVSPASTHAASLIQVTPSDDTYGRHNNDGPHGGETQIFVKKDNANGTGTTTRKGMIEFTLPSLPPVGAISSLTLSLDVSTFNGGPPNTTGFHIWGIADGVSIEDFDESTDTYNDFAPPFDDSGDGMSNSSGLLFDAIPGGGDDALGILTVNNTDLNTTVTFSGSTLLDFLAADTNGILTFALTRTVASGALNNGFASKEHPLLNPPTLTFTVIPEPASIALWSLTALALAAFGWKQTRRRRDSGELVEL